jgi:hypothetical protein
VHEKGVSNFMVLLLSHKIIKFRSFVKLVLDFMYMVNVWKDGNIFRFP